MTQASIDYYLNFPVRRKKLSVDIQCFRYCRTKNLANEKNHQIPHFHSAWCFEKKKKQNTA